MAPTAWEKGPRVSEVREDRDSCGEGALCSRRRRVRPARSITRFNPDRSSTSDFQQEG